MDEATSEMKKDDDNNLKGRHIDKVKEVSSFLSPTIALLQIYLLTVLFRVFYGSFEDRFYYISMD